METIKRVNDTVELEGFLWVQSDTVWPKGFTESISWDGVTYYKTKNKTKKK